MELKELENSLQQAISGAVRLLAEGHNRFRIFTPFMFDDGDHFSIVAKMESGEWIFSDEGHTFMHLSYDIPTQSLNTGTRAKIIANVLNGFGVREERGALVSPFDKDDMGAVFFSYVQALCKISDISYLTRERVASTFIDDCRRFFADFVPQERITADYTDDRIDAKGLYPVDYRINGMAVPLYVVAVNNDTKCQSATISLQYFRQHRVHYDSVVIFEDQEEVGRKPLAQLSDVVGKQFSSLPPNYDNIKQYVIGKMSAA